jgi:hypothetical protein
LFTRKDEEAHLLLFSHYKDIGARYAGLIPTVLNLTGIRLSDWPGSLHIEECCETNGGSFSTMSVAGFVEALKDILDRMVA